MESIFDIEQNSYFLLYIDGWFQCTGNSVNVNLLIKRLVNALQKVETEARQKREDKAEERLWEGIISTPLQSILCKYLNQYNTRQISILYCS